MLPVLVKDFVQVVHFLIVCLGTLKDRTLSRLRLWKRRERKREVMKADQDDEDEEEHKRKDSPTAVDGGKTVAG